ncbi:hypothetical protein [Arthrobacter sp. Ld5]|uniref:hypothetical protein n=1 Tax=Arthrobacter sp. Ld5 TaxID=649152 RepID=UPI003EB795BC
MDTIGSVREGMDVFTASGHKIGTIASVKMGDPEAVTAEGQQPEPTGSIVGSIASVFDNSPALPAERRQRLLRLGYIEIDGTGLGNHMYESAEDIDRVTAEGVFLSVSAAATRS